MLIIVNMFALILSRYVLRGVSRFMKQFDENNEASVPFATDIDYHIYIIIHLVVDK